MMKSPRPKKPKPRIPLPQKPPKVETPKTVYTRKKKHKRPETG